MCCALVASPAPTHQRSTAHRATLRRRAHSNSWHRSTDRSSERCVALSLALGSRMGWCIGDSASVGWRWVSLVMDTAGGWNPFVSPGLHGERATRLAMGSGLALLGKSASNRTNNDQVPMIVAANAASRRGQTKPSEAPFAFHMFGGNFEHAIMVFMSLLFVYFCSSHTCSLKSFGA